MRLRGGYNPGRLRSGAQCRFGTPRKKSVRDQEGGAADAGRLAREPRWPYRRWNRSTRPPESTSFCFPVKKGWHSLHSSTWRSALVECVTYVLPHEHLTVAST